MDSLAKTFKTFDFFVLVVADQQYAQLWYLRRHMAAFVAVRHSGKSTNLDLDDRSMVQKLPVEAQRKLDIVLGTLLVGYVVHVD